MSNKNKQRRKLIKIRKFWVSLLVVLLIVSGIIWWLRRDNASNVTSNEPTVVETVPSTTSSGRSIQTKGEDSPESPQPEQEAQVIPKNTLISPYGTFVSNHYPSLSGNGAPSKEESVCSTNPGVSCYIEFSKNGVVKRLPTQITDRSGTTIWEWDVKKSGFSVGSWTIKAVVSSGNNTKSRQDTIMLSVSE